MKHTISICPACQQGLEVTELTCPACRLVLKGRFEHGCRFCGMDDQQKQLLDVFLSCRGVIRDMEKALGVSYPTVRGKIDSLMISLGYAPSKAQVQSSQERADRRKEILERLAGGELTAEQAADELKQIGG